jgi:hypothetical protein
MVAIVTIIFCSYQLYVYSGYTALYGKTPSNLIWTNAIYGLSSFTKNHKHAQFISLDWGTQTQLLGFNPIPNKYFAVPIPLQISNSVQTKYVYQTFIASKQNAYYIAYTSNFVAVPMARSSFFTDARDYGYKPILVSVIKDNQAPAFSIYRLAKN